MTPQTQPVIGPILLARHADADGYRVSAIVAVNDDAPVPRIGLADGPDGEPEPIYRRLGVTVWRTDLTLPARADAAYRMGDVVYPVAADLTGDVRVAYVSCNGKEGEDETWRLADRNALWERLAAENAEAPFSLMLHGGDQVYADDVLGCHPAIAAWAKAPAAERPSHPFTAEMADAAETYLLHRYLGQLAQPGIADALARIPSLMMWDDHDIFDGWGSHPEPVQQSAVGSGLFDIARRLFRVFQQGQHADEPVPDDGLGQDFQGPAFAVVAPDLRSTRSPDRVMDEAAWQAFEGKLGRSRSADHVFIMSSVPALGPRLSWVEALIGIVPKVRKYEDDLRDQWQSRSHRAEWRRLLSTLDAEAGDAGHPVTLLSGEIHLATRGEMRLSSGTVLHQLVASGISHPPPPRLYARALGGLAALGEDPLTGQPISLHPVPGQRRIYTPERNYLALERHGGRWTARWILERAGVSDALAL